jgi:hypothetical protein
MSIFRSFLLLCLISLPLSFGLLILGSAMGYGEFRGGYAVLAFDASIDDSLIRGLLSEGSGFAGAPVSESSQWVILDNFNSLEVVPLDKYFTRIFPFDPRNDGYAEKLRDVFVRNGKRFVYIPLEQGNWTPSLLDKQFKSLLTDVPFYGEYYGTGKPISLFFASYAAASLCLLIICFVKKNTHNGMLKTAVLIPVFSSLAFFGAAGIACASLFFALFIMLKDPLNELSAMLWPSFKENSQKLRLIYKEIIKPYKQHWFFLPAFAAALAVTVIFSRLKLLFLLMVFISACAVFFFSSRVLSLSGGAHRRFTPVLIMKRRFVDFTFSVCMLPFTAAAFFAMFLTPYISGAYASDGNFEAVIEDQDYYAHLAFQSGFSTRQLGAGLDSGYPVYVSGEDGLPSPDESPGAGQAFNMDDFPAFPLRHLMDFFRGVNSGGKAGGGNSGGFPEMPVTAVLLLFAIPLFIKRKDVHSPKNNIEGIKRYSVKPRIKGARNNTLSYNGRNQSRILKDA